MLGHELMINLSEITEDNLNRFISKQCNEASSDGKTL